VDKKKQKSILIAGYYGFGNTGDEAILSAILAELCRQREDLEFTVVSSNPADTAAAFNVHSINWKDVEALLEAAKESDLIILGGGGLFQDYWGVPKGIALTASHWGISFCSAIGMLAVLYQKPFMIYSVGVGPLRSEEGQRLTRWTFQLANGATVRDQESHDLLLSLGVPEENIQIAPDPALNLPLDAASAAEILTAQGINLQAGPLVGISIRNWAEAEEPERWKKELAGALDQFLGSHDAWVVFIPFQVSEHPLENDRAAAEIVVSHMENGERASILPNSYSPTISAGLLSHCQLVIGMRLHSLIFATNAVIPSVALVYDPKVHNFMKSIGLTEYAVPLESMTSDELSQVLDSAWTQMEQTKEMLRREVDQLKERSRKTPQLALKLLDDTSDMPFSMGVVQALALQRTLDLASKEHEAQGLASKLTEEQQHVQRVYDQLWAQQGEMVALQNRLWAQQREKESLEVQLVAKENQLNEILYSKSWKLIQLLRKVRLAMLPIGSRRERLARASFRSARWVVHKSNRGTALIRESVRKHGLPGAFVRGLRLLSMRLYHANKQYLHARKYQHELSQLETVIAQHTGFFDLFHVPMGWNTALFQRFQHISLQTAKMGGLALYGGHPIVDLGITVYHKPADNLYVFDATNHQVVKRVFQALLKKKQPRILRIQSIDLITTAEDVDRFLEQGFTVVYEYIDEINPAITGAVPDLVYYRHTELLKDERVIVVATSDLLYKDVQRHRTRNFLLSTNGVDLDHWKVPKGEPPADLKPALNGNLIIAYHGALAKWIDYELLRKIADEGSYELLLIGHEHDRAFAESGLKEHPRVHFLGSKPYFQLNRYAIHYDIAILPFRSIELTQSVSPVKIFEYMAARKPIVTTDLRECRKYQSCLIGEDHSRFMEQLQRAAALRSEPEYLSVLDQEAADNSWQKKTMEILSLAGVKI
jgi:polysaccharide pyruvyl transferase CsaB